MIRIGGILIDALLDHVTEMANEALDRPGRRIAQCADRMALDLIGDIQQHIDLALLGAPIRHAGQDPPHPARAFAAGRALAAALMLVEISQPANGADDVGRFVHHDDGRGAEARFQIAQ